MVEVEEVSSVSSQFDYLAFLRCTTHEKLDELLDRIGNLEGVKQTQTSIILNRKIDRRGGARPLSVRPVLSGTRRCP